MLTKVAEQFSDDQVDWLNQQTEFTTACGQMDSFGDIVAVGKKLIAGRKPVHKPQGFSNGIPIPESLPVPTS